MNDKGHTLSSRADLHCHSTASQVSRLGVQRALGLPECATPPEEVYDLAKRRGMDFVTITDHDTIDGALEIADRYEDAFVSEELTAWFRDEPQAVHVLCLGITPEDHEWLQAHAYDVEQVAEYLADRGIAASLAHPFYAVAAPLTPRHRRRLARLFDVWETRNGSRAHELNLPAAVYVDTHGGAGTGGSDDHAGVDIGRTHTSTPAAATWPEFLAHVRGGRCSAHGDQGSAAKWAHAAMALAVRTHGNRGETKAPNPLNVLRMVQRVTAEGDVRRGAIGADLGPEDARSLLRAWLRSIEHDLPEDELLALLQADEFTHADLFRRARRCHERRLVAAIDRVVRESRHGAEADFGLAGLGLFDACVAAVPYVPAASFLGREKAKLAVRDGEPVRVALVADGVGATHGVTRTLEEIRERGVAGFDIDVIGTDPKVDRRLASVAEVEMPFYEGLRIGVPSVPAVVEAIADGRYDLVHLVSPGPAGVVAALVARIMGLPVLGSYHTELARYAGLRTGDERMELLMAQVLGTFYGQCDHVLAPSRSAEGTVGALGIPAGRIGRWDRGVDTGRFSPALRDPMRFAGGAISPITVLYAGRLTKEKGVDLLVDAFLEARLRQPRLHLVLAGGGPEQEAMERRLGHAATFLGWQTGEELATTFASADLFLFCSQNDTFGQVILEAQASGLPVVAVAAGGPGELVQDGRSGCLVPPEVEIIAATLVGLASSRAARERLAAGGLAAVAERTWERSLGQLAAGYREALAAASHAEGLLRAA